MPQSSQKDLLQQPPGSQVAMVPQPITDDKNYKGSEKLKDKVAIITGGDSGIGQAVAISFAKEGADSAVVYLSEDQDAAKTKEKVEFYNRKCILIKGDITEYSFCEQTVEKVLKEFGKINVLVNNAAEQHPKESVEEITPQQLERTFRTNIFSMFYLTQLIVGHLKEGDSIINTASVTAYRGSEKLLDYSSTKGAIVAFTRSLSQNLADKKIRVNAVAPGPIWTPLIVSTFPKEKVESFGSDAPLKRAGQPYEVASSFVFLASDILSSYMTGQVLHPNGGEVVNT